MRFGISVSNVWGDEKYFLVPIVPEYLRKKENEKTLITTS